MNDIHSNYTEFFKTAFGVEPFDYQRRLATDDTLPSLINAPTGSGKTAAILGAWLWRRLDNPLSVGRRLVYCLPMRTLVEQTHGVAEKAINNLKQAFPNRFKDLESYVLMGGEVEEKWEYRPELECILIGTQDMLLSRALNRGYAMKRYRWPVHFGLLNNDCLWVLDEVQLMGSGLATSTQLQAFRRKMETFGRVQTIWMSATVERDWLKTVDIEPDKDIVGSLALDLDKETAQPLHDAMGARKTVRKAKAKVGDLGKLAKEVLSKHSRGSRTIVVVNTVQRAVDVYDALKGELEKKKSDAEPVLIHSRFRPPDRQKKITALLADPDEAGTIIVSTQVVEAGIDVSAKTLFSELAPWPSLVQRFGRCNRRGEYKGKTEDDKAEIVWIDLKSSDCPPYEEKDMNAARKAIEEFNRKDAGPMSLGKWAKGLEEKRKAELFRYEQVYVIREHDVQGLFSTEPDLAGGYTDVSHFVRNVERDTDAYVYWREFKGSPSVDEPAPRRDELCPVRFFKLKDLLGSKGVAWQWNGETGKWEPLRERELRPGMTLLLSRNQGGYSDKYGWTGKSADKPTPIPLGSTGAKVSTNPQESLADDMPSETDWLPVPDHLRDAEAEARVLIGQLEFDGMLWPRCAQSVIKGAWWHDVGKTVMRSGGDGKKLFAWQDAAFEQLDAMKQKGKRFLTVDADADEVDFVREFLPMLERRGSDSDLWAKFPGLDQELKRSKLSIDARKRIKREMGVGFRPGLRHEAASALAAWHAWQSKAEGWNALAVYLVACHHGKVRTVLRGTRSHDDVFGIKPGDSLPVLAEWLLSETPLDLRPKNFGAIGEWDDAGNNYSIVMPSWVQMVAELLGPELPDDPDPRSAITDESEPRKLGPFRLAFLEALIRAADVSASRKPGRGKRNE